MSQDTRIPYVAERTYNLSRTKVQMFTILTCVISRATLARCVVVGAGSGPAWGMTGPCIMHSELKSPLILIVGICNYDSVSDIVMDELTIMSFYEVHFF